jgi:predicted AAA+ superfamily ATPase
MVIRENYLKQLRSLRDQKLIKVITGLRRSGKSTLFQQFRDELLKSGVKQRQIQSYNFEEIKNQKLLNYQTLHDAIEAKLVPETNNYIFLDEIQMVDGFEKTVDSLFVKENIDIYITGSNAYLLSGELATLLTGRFISLHVLPFSFAEYRAAFPDEIDETKLFSQFLAGSALPEAVNLSKTSPDFANHYIADLFATILEKDIYPRYDIRNKANFTRVVKFMMNNIGKPVSSTNIAEALNSEQETKINHNTIDRWLGHLVDCFMLYPASRYDIKGKKLLTTNDKYYTVDLGLRTMILSESQGADIGRKLENIVYLELLRRGGQVWVGKNKDKEVDFVVQKSSGDREYYQVAYHLSEHPATLMRELAPLKTLRDNYPKYIISADFGNSEINGIKQVNVIDWLLGIFL